LLLELVGVHGGERCAAGLAETLGFAVFAAYFAGPETTVPAFAGTVFININSEESTSSWQPSSCRLSSSLTSLLSLP